MSKIKQIQIGDDTYDLSVNAGDIEGNTNDILVLKVDDDSNNARQKMSDAITSHYGKGLVCIIQGPNPVNLYHPINSKLTDYGFSQNLSLLEYNSGKAQRQFTTVTATGTWDGDVFTCTKLAYYARRELYEGAWGLKVNNQSEYNPTPNSYNPATTKYVDDNIPQKSTMSTATSSDVGKIVQFIGTTDANYTNGYFYIGTEDSGTYSWEQINVQPSNSDTIQNVKYLGSIDNYNTKQTRLDLDALDEGMYCVYVPRYTTTAKLYYKITVNGNVYDQYAYSLDDASAFLTNHVMYIRMLHNVSGITVTEDTTVLSFIKEKYIESLARIQMQEDNLVAKANGTTTMYNGNSRTLINLATQDTDQTISGKKTFTTLPESSVVPTTNDQLVNKTYVDNAITTAITTSLGGSY